MVQIYFHSFIKLYLFFKVSVKRTIAECYLINLLRNTCLFFKQRGMFLVRIFEVIYALYPAHARANIHKIKMEKSKLRDFLQK